MFDSLNKNIQYYNDRYLLLTKDEILLSVGKISLKFEARIIFYGHGSGDTFGTGCGYGSGNGYGDGYVKIQLLNDRRTGEGLNADLGLDNGDGLGMEFIIDVKK